MFTLFPPAKINWFLHILGKRDDGYHEIVSLMQRVTLTDSLVIEDADEVEIVTESAIPKEDNLVYRAAMAVKEERGIGSGVKITLTKAIPMAAGLGGGSSDAAATIKGLNIFWDLGLTERELAAIGARVGSDVPFFFYGPAALIGGRGEVVTPVRLGRSYTIVLVKPPVGISTAWAYGRTAVSVRGEVLTKEDDNIKLFCQALERGDFALLSSLHRNDLESPVVKRYPVIDELKRTLIEKGAVFSAMSGSGPTVFGVFVAEDEAQKAIGTLPGMWCRVVKTLASDA